MRQMTQRRLWPLVMLASVILCQVLASRLAFGEGAHLQTFVLKDDIGQTWRHDIVSFPLEHPLSTPELAGVALLSPDGEQVPFQVSAAGQGAKITFLADVLAYGESSYRLVRQAPKAAPAPLQIERNAGSLRVSNGITGVEVPTAAGRYQDGPILGIRMKSGAWIGGSRLTTPRAIEGYDAAITAEGPVFTDIACRYRFAGGKSWALDLRVIADEPVVLIRETFNLDDNSRWEFLANQRFAPNQAFMKSGEDTNYTFYPLKYQDGNVQVQLCPWSAWWDHRNTTFFGLFRAPDGVSYLHDDKLQRLVRKDPTPAGEVDRTTAPDGGASDDMLIAAAGDVASWARSGPDVWDNCPAKFVPLKASADGQLALQLQLAAPGRRWLLGAGSVKEALVADSDVAPAQHLLNRYCETPLDTVKDMPLHWQQTATYPRLVLKADEVQRLVASPDYEKMLAKSLEGTALKRTLFPLIAGQALPKDQRQIADLKQDIAAKLDNVLAYFRYGNNHRACASFGTLIPRVDIGYVLPPLDLALGAGIYTPAEKARLFAQLAFVADKLYSPDYESPGRSLTGNPNMVTAWCATLVELACMMPEHPHAQAWYNEGMGRLDNMLEKWQGPNGAWLEAPHYMMAAIDPIFLAKTAAVNSGFLAGRLDERFLRTVMFLAKISTPPDPRFGQLRHFPPLGNTYLMETSLIFGATAKLYRQSEPQKAAELQWMWQQQGRPHWVALGGASAVNFYAELLMDETWNPAAPLWASEAFPGFGAVLGSGFPGDRETYMVYHQGDVSVAHYDYDQGSFEMWGKGRPLCLDWGYNNRAPAWEHNCMDIGNATGKVLEFAALPSADYVHGRQADGIGAWDRQTLFVKDRDPLGPTYYVLRDSTTGAGTANWWLWVNTRKDDPKQTTPNLSVVKPADGNASPQKVNAIQVAGDVVHAIGEHDVDLDIWFAPAKPARLKGLEIKDWTVATVTGYLGGGWSSWTEGKTTQQGLHLVQSRGETLVSVLYPKLHTDASPQFTSLAAGKVIKVAGAGGEDYVFLSLEPFEYHDGPISFSGTAGAIQHRGAQVTLSLNAAGEIGFGKAHLASQTPQTKVFGEF